MLLWSGLDMAGLAPVDASLEVLSCAMQRPRELASCNPFTPLKSSALGFGLV